MVEPFVESIGSALVESIGSAVVGEFIGSGGADPAVAPVGANAPGAPPGPTELSAEANAPGAAQGEEGLVADDKLGPPGEYDFPHVGDTMWGSNYMFTAQSSAQCSAREQAGFQCSAISLIFVERAPSKNKDETAEHLNPACSRAEHWAELWARQRVRPTSKP